MIDVSNDEAWANLGNAVVEKAVNDYRWALWYLDRFTNVGSRWSEAMRTKEECEEFFTSEHFDIFSGLDGVALMQTIKKEPRQIRCSKW